LARRGFGLSFEELRELVGLYGSRPLLDVVWPDWEQEERARVCRTLRAAAGSASAEDIKAFVAFLSESGLEAFFWRLHSFEKHAFGGHEFALKAMKSDVQGMAVTVEHVAVALGGSETQLIERFKQLWQANQNVLGVLKDNATRPLAVRKDLAVDWPNLKARIDDLRTRPGGEVAADLVMAHRIRGGIHQELPVGDHFELERLFVLLMRVALATFVEVRRRSDESGS
jgi:hypothetical protein